MDEIEIVKPNESDIDSLIGMHAQSWIDTFPNEEYGITLEFIQDHVDKRMFSKEGRDHRQKLVQEAGNNPGYYLRVAKNSLGSVVGFVDARRQLEYELSGLYIDKSLQGTGLATSLVCPALKWVGMENNIKLVVAPYNHRAIRFYEKLGFEKVAGSESFHSNKPLPVIEMLRKGTKGVA